MKIAPASIQARKDRSLESLQIYAPSRGKNERRNGTYCLIANINEKFDLMYIFNFLHNYRYSFGISNAQETFSFDKSQSRGVFQDIQVL